NSPPAPGPDLGGNIIKNRKSFFNFFGEAQIEPRRIDQDQGVRLEFFNGSQSPVKNFPIAKILAEHIRETEGGHLGHVLDDFYAGLRHERPADSMELSVRAAFQDFSSQVASM